MENKIVHNLIPIIDENGITANPAICKIMVDKNDCLGLSTNGIYEPLITELIKSNAKKGNIVCDIGAHIGYYSLLMSCLVGKKGMVYAFEPESDNYDVLIANTKLNPIKNIVAEKKAVSNFSGTAVLYKSEDNSGDHRLCYGQNDRMAENVDVVELDVFFEGKEKPNFIKIDTQGTEFHIFISLLRFIKDVKSPKIICEFSPYLLSDAGIQGIEFLNLLLDNQFNVFHIDDINNKVYPADIQYLLDKFPADRDVGTNLFCIRNV